MLEYACISSLFQRQNVTLPKWYKMKSQQEEGRKKKKERKKKSTTHPRINLNFHYYNPVQALTYLPHSSPARYPGDTGESEGPLFI